jgi:hypothetical protein
MKLKALASAVLVTMGGSASASLLNDGFTPGKPSDLLLAIYDDSTGLASSGKTYLLNTHLNYGDIVNGVVKSKVIDLSDDANYQALKVSGSKLRYNVVGGYSLAANFSNYDRTGSSGKPFTDPTSAQWGVVTTGRSASDFNGEFGNLSDTTANRIFAYWNAANVKLTAAGATPSSGPDSVVVPKGDPQASFDVAWNGNFGGGGIANVSTANLINGEGDAAKFFWVTNTDFANGAVIELGSWVLNGDKLVYTASGYTPPPVSGNQPPVASAGAPQSVTAGAQVTLDGSASSDPDNGPSPLAYSWTQVSGPSVALNDAATAKPSFTATADGVYVFKLTVSDGKDNSEATTQVTVNEAGPAPLVGPALRLSVPAAWRVGQAQTVTFIANELKPSAKVIVRFSANGGQKFKTIKTVKLKKGRFLWKPTKRHVTQQGVIQACVKKSSVCDQVTNIVVQR